MSAPRAIFLLLLFLGVAPSFACGGKRDDDLSSRLDDVARRPPASSLQGTGLRVRDVTDPDKQGRPAVDSIVTVTGVGVVAVDTFDETRNGKSHGTVFVQDLGEPAPYSGVSLYGPTFVPGDLRVGAGDVLDFTGLYQETKAIGTAVFPVGQVLPQLAKPVGTFRYETTTGITPVTVPVDDLGDYAKGRKWIGMLATVQNVTVMQAPRRDGSNRLSAALTAATANAPTLTNELFDLADGDVTLGTKYKSVTGVVTYFFSLHLAPRSRADLVK
jgi:hypothetical protein